MEKISVCIATYNGEKFIHQQLQSILKQLRPDDEVIISDDSSSDATIRIVKSFEDRRVRILEGQIYQSPIFNFENALAHSTGEIIILADQDDVWLDNKVETVLLEIKDADLILSDCAIINERGQVTEKSFFKLNGSKKGFIKNLIKNSYLGCCLALRRSVLNKALPFPKNIPMHDWWIGLVCEVFFKIKIVPQPLMLYRRHGINATPTGEESRFSYVTRLQFRWALLKGISKLYGFDKN